MNDALTPSSPSETALAAVNERVDLLDHVDPRRASFYSDAAAVAAYLIHGHGPWLEACRCVLTAGIMSVAIAAARDNRTCSLPEVRGVLAEASRRIDFESSVDRTPQVMLNNEVGASIDV